MSDGVQNKNIRSITLFTGLVFAALELLVVGLRRKRKSSQAVSSQQNALKP